MKKVVFFYIKTEDVCVMPYILQIKDLTEYEGKAFLNSKGNAECVEFVRQTLGLPPTLRWKEGKITKITKIQD